MSQQPTKSMIHGFFLKSNYYLSFKRTFTKLKILFIKPLSLVPRAGLEPARLTAGDFKSPVSTNFTTEAKTFTTNYYNYK